jgi:5S rRNA maturation endonuclease (ribonuclease M5)
MEQQAHTTKASDVTSLVDWMNVIMSETNGDETNIHTVKQFQIVKLQTGYQIIVLCDHDERTDLS